MDKVTENQQGDCCGQRKIRGRFVGLSSSSMVDTYGKSMTALVLRQSATDRHLIRINTGLGGREQQVDQHHNATKKTIEDVSCENPCCIYCSFAKLAYINIKV